MNKKMAVHKQIELIIDEVRHWLGRGSEFERELDALDIELTLCTIPAARDVQARAEAIREIAHFAHSHALR
ncbi:MAG: hypothetical protein C4555_04420 [Dehalococcoidia bacterium]|nr:MAG: hypothetical protein C4555_04420 [Dehalococcoidia bacterium]